MGKLKGGNSGGGSRKELRKAHRQAAKEKKQQRHTLKQVEVGCVPCLSCWQECTTVRFLLSQQ